MAKLIDLSHTVEDGLVTYKGLPAPIICDYLSREASKLHYEEGTSFQIGKIEMCSNTGTYIDSPFHRYEDGDDLSELDLDAVAHLDGVKIKIPQHIIAIDESYFADMELTGKAVLIQTNWSRHWNTELYYESHPFLTEGAALFLKKTGVLLVGIDSHNIDDTRGGGRPVHSTLLGADILIVEHMCNLQSIPENGFYFYAVPVKVKGFGTFPVRAFAQLQE
ncbi:cyclase family protein [Aliiglaciecola sp. 3_MG-2023]|uniref:cyclase family protein n=1 Tax=Aliiglaciecola sp. 3_MG-2023 TaxID=3062644 RepID=UPI0026E25B0F|nr:cyclase family protein [Aliiglaciecola sp. 3_MG-2023]MDO6694443.1 cyclase family protein [Aliiglaciecola sp. 3_MG-2023]